MTSRVEQIQAEYEQKMAAEVARHTAFRYEAELARFVIRINAQGVDRLALAEALRSMALKVQLEAEREGYYR